MPHASPSESYASRGAAVENGIVPAEMQLDNGSRTEGDAIDLLLVLARHKKRILQITLAAALLALAVALLLPNMYTATTTILPPQQKQSALNAMVGQLGALAKLGGMTDLGLKNPSDLFVAMLKSRTIEDALVNRFDLRKVYGERRYQDARKKLEGRSSISAGDEGLISISVGDRDPKRAAELANAYVDELHSLNQNLAITEAGQRRLFYEQKLDAEREELARADLALEHGQEKSGLIEPEAQGKAIIASVADMRAQIAIREVQLQAMRSYATENNPDLKRAEAELAGMRGQLAKLESDTGVLGNGNLAVPTRKLPQAALEYIRRARDLGYHEALYEFLVKQLEAARIDEANDAFTVQVVDHAVVPERRSSPKRMLIVVVATGVAFLLACFGALLLEALRRKQQDPNERARLALLFHSFRFSSWRA